MLSPNQTLELNIEKAAAGGRMLARSNGLVVLVAGAIPGERVTARVERVSKGVAFAEAVSVDAPSPDRRAPFDDPLCGGCVYSHIAYPRQLEIKAAVITDAFTRIGRLELPGRIGVAGSPEDGYRMRARLHVRGSRVGFFREGSHELCNPRTTRQLLPATCDALERLMAAMRSLGIDVVRAIELSENVDASDRAVYLDAASEIDARAIATLAGTDGFTGMTSAFGVHGRAHVVDRLVLQEPHEPQGLTLVSDPRLRPGVKLAGLTPVSDPVSDPENGKATVALRRHVLAFFQGNRHLLRTLVTHVVDQVRADGAVLDLYAGVGLFSVSAAIARGGRVTAVEGDRHAAADLTANAAESGRSIVAVHQSVEDFLGSVRLEPDDRPSTVIVDPPRTGLSKDALDGVLRLRASRLVYVSCDVATLARDARRIADAGERYAIARADAFDLFPNTPHVETVVVFDRL
jgi:23S rRNA (uracil1939-C5)-methyltransferase